MTKTKYWLSLLAISVVLVAGSLAVSPIAIAGEDEDDEDDDGGAGVLNQILTIVTGIEEDLQVKKSFFEVKNEVTFNFDPNMGKIFEIHIELVCPQTIPSVKQAFILEGLHVATTGQGTLRINDDVTIDGKFSTRILQTPPVTLVDNDSAIYLLELGLGQLAASDSITADSVNASPNPEGQATQLTIEVVAIGEMPQGCNVTLDADRNIIDSEI